MKETVRVMADLVYTRVSTDEQSTQRQAYLLAEAGLTGGAEGVRLFSDPATSSKIPALERAGFRELARYARPGDRITVSELYRLCRDLTDILALRDWCQQHKVQLRVLSGALSNITDLAATDATTTMLVNVLVSVGQFQRDLQNELTRQDSLLPGQPATPPVADPATPSSARPTRSARATATEPASPPWPANTGSAAARSAPRSPTCYPTNPTGRPSQLPQRRRCRWKSPAKSPPTSPNSPNSAKRAARAATRAHRPTRPGLQPARQRPARGPPSAAGRRGHARHRRRDLRRPQGIPDLH
ncbi:recombinase family protein [Micromonospora sp. M12]